GRAARRRRREVAHRLVRDRFVEALDDERPAARRLLQFREADDDTEADEEGEHEDGAGREPLDSADGQLRPVPGAHERSSDRGRVGSGTLYWTSPRRTSSIARRSALWATGTSSPSKRTRAPRRSCLARSAATSTNRKRLSIGGAGSAGTTGSSA